jgi:hypothetical protein
MSELDPSAELESRLRACMTSWLPRYQVVMMRRTTPTTASGTQPPRWILTMFAPKNARSTARKPPASAPARHGDQRHRGRAITQTSIVVTAIVPVTATPYAAASALDDRKSTTRSGRVSRPREVGVAATLADEVVKARDVRAHTVHRRHLEGGRRGRQADRHEREPVAVALQEVPEEGHVARRQCARENITREAIDLHDQEPPLVGRRRGGAATDMADETIDGPLDRQRQIVYGHRHCLSEALAPSGTRSPTRSSRIVAGAVRL